MAAKTQPTRRACALVPGWLILGLLVVGAAYAQGDSYQTDIAAPDVRILEEARALRAAKKSEQAVALLQPLVARQPGYFNAQFELGLALSDRPDSISLSVPVLERAAALKRSLPEVTDARVFNSLGWAYTFTGQSVKARQAFAEAQAHLDQLTPEVQARLYSNIGYLDLMSGRRAEAQKNLQIGADKGSRPARQNLEVLQAVDRRKKAQQQ
jgi:Flp pilus assembly protein TadD